MLQELTREFKVQHHFSTAYSPWSKGSVERVCRKVLRSCKALLSEWRLAPQDWPCVIECTQSIINHAPLTRLRLRDARNPRVYQTPLEVFSGLRPSRPLMLAPPPTRSSNSKLNEEAKLRRLFNINEIQISLEHVHKEVVGKVSASRKRAIKSHNNKCCLAPIN